MPKIKKIRAYKILDSRGEWTIEAEITLDNGIVSRACVPQGKSIGSFEAHSVPPETAIKNIRDKIEQSLLGIDIEKQEEIDRRMIDLDGTDNKSNLGANSILGVSLGCARAAAFSLNIPVWKYLRSKYKFKENNNPRLFLNVINGGLHAGNNLKFQEYMIIPKGKNLTESVGLGVSVYQAVKKYLVKNLGKNASGLGDEGGFAPDFSNDLEPFEILKKVIGDEGFTDKFDLGMDAAASNIDVSGQELTKTYEDIKDKFNIYYIEDSYREDDFDNFSKLKKSIGGNTIIAGDDLTTTNIERMKIAKEKDSINGIIIKPNQIGTLTETIAAIKLAKEWGWFVVVSHRSGETNDDFIVDLAIGAGADGIKIGAPARGERTAKFNRILEIGREILS